PNDLFMRGIDTVKQGNSELLRFIREKIMWEAMGINNTRSIHKIVEDTLRDARFKQADERKNSNLRYKKDGSKSIKKGDYMEFPEIAKEFNMKIDIRHYLEQTVGMCVRFINEDNMFLPPSSDKIMQIKDSDIREKQIDKYSQKKAKNWLIKYIKSLQ
ncbi:675_t:CDS:2, partial [Funneliformis geosporum]